MFGGIGLPELLIILLLAFIIFGAGKLPGVGKALGKSIREFKDAVKEEEGESPKEQEEKN